MDISPRDMNSTVTSTFSYLAAVGGRRDAAAAAAAAGPRDDISTHAQYSQVYEPVV